MNPLNLLGLTRRKISKLRIAEINKLFDVAEKKGRIYLLCGGNPVKEFGYNTTVCDIILEIQKARMDALRYHGIAERSPELTEVTADVYQ